jgi:SAM-dependent methyltransferase
MMFGTRELFFYLECPSCRSLVIEKIPEDLSRHYPRNYYSFSSNGPIDLLREVIFDATLGRLTLFGHLGSLLCGPNGNALALRRLKARKDARILDYGCGSGALLFSLKKNGFSQLQGVDPYASDKTPTGIPIYRSLSSVSGLMDLIFVSHVLEHVAEPRNLLTELADLLTPSGKIIVRCPVIDSRAHELFGRNWVQLDPPRHLMIPSRHGLRVCAQSAGLHVERGWDDSTAFQFWGSTLYKHNIPLYGGESPTQSSLARFRAMPRMVVQALRAHLLNFQCRGDQICWILNRASSEKSASSQN